MVALLPALYKLDGPAHWDLRREVRSAHKFAGTDGGFYMIAMTAISLMETVVLRLAQLN
jgi:hypothetical protein